MSEKLSDKQTRKIIVLAYFARCGTISIVFLLTVVTGMLLRLGIEMLFFGGYIFVGVIKSLGIYIVCIKTQTTYQ